MLYRVDVRRMTYVVHYTTYVIHCTTYDVRRTLQKQRTLLIEHCTRHRSLGISQILYKNARQYVYVDLQLCMCICAHIVYTVHRTLYSVQCTVYVVHALYQCINFAIALFQCLISRTPFNSLSLSRTISLSYDISLSIPLHIDLTPPTLSLSFETRIPLKRVW